MILRRLVDRVEKADNNVDNLSLASLGELLEAFDVMRIAEAWKETERTN